jgi:transposase
MRRRVITRRKRTNLAVTKKNKRRPVAGRIRTLRVAFATKLHAVTHLHHTPLACLNRMTRSHFQSKQRLIAHAQHAGSMVFIVIEHFASNTCGHRGNLHTDLGSNKRFQCLSCNVVMDRDANAARNILLRNLPSLID